ncbi:MAG: prepilin-type N-terminal cleavage/methylation domain-containing protein [Gemmatimonadaceae bacterium]
MRVTSRRARGFTLVEMLTVMVVLGVLVGAVAELTLRQQWFHQAVGLRLGVRRALHDAELLLRFDLRGLAPSRGDIYALSPDRVDYRSLIGVSVVCTLDSTRTVIGIPIRRSTGASLTSWRTAPQEGDTVLVYETALSPDSVQWRVHVLVAEPAAGGNCPVASGLSASAADAAGALRLTLTPALPATVTPGASIRFVRAARYQLYRASDDRWYLGYTDCLASRATPCATIQPVSGPYAAGGLRFSFRDSTGAETNDPERFAWLQVVVRAVATAPSRAQGYEAGPFADSLTLIIRPRN